MDRINFAGGPGHFTHDSKTITMHDDTWSLKVGDRTMERSNNLRGFLGHAKDYSIGTISFDPVVTSSNLAGLITYLFPYTLSSIGSLVFGTTDKPVVISTRDGKTITLAAAALTKMPRIVCAPGKNLFQGAELTCLIANNSDGTGATDFVQEGTASYTEPTLDPLTLVSSLFDVDFGSTLTGIETDENGVVFEPTLTLEDCKTSNGGLLNYRIARLAWVAKFTPVNMTAAQFFDTLYKLDNSVGRGQMVGTRGDTFTVTGNAVGAPLITMPLAVPLDDADVRFGRQSRIGEVSLTAQPKFSGGAWQQLLTVGQVTE